MKDVAALIIIFVALFNLILTVISIGADGGWKTGESPITGQCYEIRTLFFGFGIGQGMAPIASEYCEAP
jgi:hypothetical protein